MSIAASESNHMTEKKKLTVGVVSTQEHIKTVTKLLKERGHHVIPLPLLGKGQRMPPNADVIVCRILGSSHAATSICFEENRLGSRPVIFRNGTTSIMQQIELVEKGAWAPDWRLIGDANVASLEVDPEEQTPEQAAEAERLEHIATCRAGIQAMLEKGNVFCTALTLLNNLERAKDVVCRITYPNRDRVKRTGVVDAMRHFKHKSSVVDEQLAILAVEGGLFQYRMFSQSGMEIKEELILAKDELTPDQVSQFVKGLDQVSKKNRYFVDRPEVKVEKVVVPDVQMSDPSPVLEPVLPLAVEVALPPEIEVVKVKEVEAEPRPQQMQFISGDTEKEVGDCLEMVANALDMYGIQHLSTEMLAKFGLSIEKGMLTLNVVHMASPTGACCNGAATRVSYKSSAVNCKACRETSIYRYMAWHEANAV